MGIYRDYIRILLRLYRVYVGLYRDYLGTMLGLRRVFRVIQLALVLLACGNGRIQLRCVVSFCRSGRYRFGISLGVSHCRVPRIILQCL